MRVLFIGDPHLKINRFDLATKFLAWLNALIEEQRPDLVVNLGDTFDTHAVLRSEVMNEFMAHVYKTLDLGIPYVYLVGNHDMYKPNDARYHAMRPYKDKIKNLYVVDQIQDLFEMTFVPFQPNGSTFPKQTLPVCVAHQTFLGADYGTIRATDGVDPASVQGAEVIISGHIHGKSVVGSTVHYVGSPFSQSASDVDQVKGITIFRTDTFAQEFFECPLPSWRRLNHLITQSDGIGELHDQICCRVSGSKDHWVLEIEGPKAEIVGYLGSEEYIKAIDGVDVKVKTKYTDKEKKKLSIESNSMEHIISEYVVKVYNGSLDKDKLKETAKAVLLESRTVK
jgi:DNA repair exonuclease SbcCD nuclease subunit